MLQNDPDLAGQAVAILQNAFNPQTLRQMRPVLGSEDFAFYALNVPGFYFFLGTRGPGAASQTLHSPDFDPDEAALTVGLTAAAHLLTGLSRPLWPA